MQPQPSPQIKRKQTPTRPISFVRALEMTDSMEMQTLEQQQQTAATATMVRNNGALNIGVPTSLAQQNAAAAAAAAGRKAAAAVAAPNAAGTSDRASIYDMNYEISV